MADAFIRVPDDAASTGKRVDNESIAIGGEQHFRQRVVIADAVEAARKLAITAAGEATVSAASLPLPAGAATQATLASLLAELQAKADLAEMQPVSGPVTDVQLRASEVAVKDNYSGGEVLAEQDGAGAVLTFSFAANVQLVVVESQGADLVSRADPFGGTPSASVGWPCRDEVPSYFPIATSAVKVFAPAGASVNVMGYRH